MKAQQALCLRKHCLCKEQRKIRDKPVFFTHDYLANLTHQPTPQTYFQSKISLPATTPEILTLVSESAKKNSREALDQHLQALLVLTQVAKQDPHSLTSALQKAKPALQELYAPAQSDIKKQAAQLTSIALLVPLWTDAMWDQAVQNPSLFLDIADEGLETKSYEILSATFKLILAFVKQKPRLLALLVDKTVYLERVYLVLMSEKTELWLAGHALEHLLLLVTSEYGLASPEISKIHCKFLEALAPQVFEFTKLATKKFAILGYTCLERMLDIVQLSATVAAEVDGFCQTIEDTFFVHPVEEIQIAAGKLFLKILRKEATSVDHVASLVERALKHFNSKSHKLSGLNCDLLIVLLRHFELPGKLIVDQILHLTVSSLEVMKGGGGVYVSYARIFSLIFESLDALSKKDYEVFVKTQGTQIAREMIETLDTLKEKKDVWEAVQAIGFMVKHEGVPVELDEMTEVRLRGIVEKLELQEWVKEELQTELGGLVGGKKTSVAAGGKIEI